MRKLPESHPKARCLVVTGHGNSFAAGADLAWLEERSKTDPSKNIQIMKVSLAFSLFFITTHALFYYK